MAGVFADDIYVIQCSGPVLALDMNNDGTLLAVAMDAPPGEASVKLYRLPDGRLMSEHGSELGTGYGVTIVDAARHLVYLLEDGRGNKHLFRTTIAGGKAEHMAEYGLSENSYSLARDQVGRRMAVLGNFVDVWDLQTSEVIYHEEAASPEHRVRASLSANGAFLFAYGTVDGQVVRYDVAADLETDRWKAPSPFGEQLAISASGRIFAAAANKVRGLFLYDTETGARIRPERFDEKTLLSGRYVLSNDGALLVFCRSGVACMNLNTDEWILGPRLPSRSRCTASTFAWEAPVVAFGQADGRVAWARLTESAEPPT